MSGDRFLATGRAAEAASFCNAVGPFPRSVFAGQDILASLCAEDADETPDCMGLPGGRLHDLSLVRLTQTQHPYPRNRLLAPVGRARTCFP